MRPLVEAGVIEVPDFGAVAHEAAAQEAVRHKDHGDDDQQV